MKKVSQGIRDAWFVWRREKSDLMLTRRTYFITPCQEIPNVRFDVLTGCKEISRASCVTSWYRTRIKLACRRSAASSAASCSRVVERLWSKKGWNADKIGLGTWELDGCYRTWSMETGTNETKYGLTEANLFPGASSLSGLRGLWTSTLAQGALNGLWDSCRGCLLSQLLICVLGKEEDYYWFTTALFACRQDLRSIQGWDFSAFEFCFLKYSL
jgi:hypothetical protein